MNTDELFMDISKLPKPLSKQEISELFEKIKNGDQQAREKIVLHNIRLVLKQVARKYNSVECDKRDLVSLGNIGLIKAVNTFDISKKFEFSTYAMRCIDNEILMFLRKSKNNLTVESLNRQITEENEQNGITIENVISDATNIEEEYIQREIFKIINEEINSLPNFNKEIIIMYFGFYDNKRYTQMEIAQKFNLSQASLSRIISKTINYLKYRLQQRGAIEIKNNSNKVKRL